MQDNIKIIKNERYTYRTYHVPYLSCTVPAMYRTYHVPYLPCTVPIMYRTYHVPYIPCTVPTMYRTYHVPYLPRTVPTMYRTYHVPYLPCTAPTMCPKLSVRTNCNRQKNVVRPRRDGQTKADENVISMDWFIPCWSFSLMTGYSFMLQFSNNWVTDHWIRYSTIGKFQMRNGERRKRKGSYNVLII